MLAVYADARAALITLPAPLSSAALRLLDRITPPYWTVEWYLPQWLGDAYALSPEATHALVLANVYGLGYIGLQDDLVDGEMDDESRALKVCLAGALYRLWTEQCIGYFPAASPFWQQCHLCMNQWLLATLQSNQQPNTDFFTFVRESYLHLAWRGAPLKICCAGAHLLAQIEFDLHALLDAVDHLLAAAVLLDHERDWQEDLAAGRYNTFVHFASPLPQVLGEQEANRRQVLEKILLERATAPYFELIQEQIDFAMEKAQVAGCMGLLTYLQDFSADIRAHQTQLADNVTAALQRASSIVFGPNYGANKEGR
jgi:hypothetical protein